MENVKVIQEYGVKSEQYESKEKPLFDQMGTENTQKEEKSKNVVKVDKIGKTSFSGYTDRKKLEINKMVYSCTGQQ